MWRPTKIKNRMVSTPGRMCSNIASLSGNCSSETRAGLGLLPEVLIDCGRAIYLDYLQHSMNDGIVVNTRTLVVSNNVLEFELPASIKKWWGSSILVPVLDRFARPGWKAGLAGIRECPRGKPALNWSYPSESEASAATSHPYPSRAGRAARTVNPASRARVISSCFRNAPSIRLTEVV